MLEQTLREYFQEMAAPELPPGPVSLSAAARKGRTRIRLRRTSVIAAPIFAAGSVLAIAIASLALSGTGARPTAPSGRAPAPSHFSLSRPYGWIPVLPRGSEAPAAGLTRVEEDVTDVLSAKPFSFLDFNIFAAGLCHARAQMLLCASVPPAQAFAYPIGARVGTINGFAAYWDPGSAGLTWQYAGRGWASLNIGGHRRGGLDEILRLARSARFGTRAAPAVVYPLPLRSVPADWQVSAVEGTVGRGRVLPADSYTVTAGPVDLPNGNLPIPAGTPQISVLNSGGCPSSPNQGRTTSRVINGVRVTLTDYSGGAPHLLCALHADGLAFYLQLGGHPQIGAVDLFASHMRLLGPNPEHWTTRLIG